MSETEIRPVTEIRTRSGLETDPAEGKGPDTAEQILQLRGGNEETNEKKKIVRESKTQRKQRCINILDCNW